MLEISVFIEGWYGLTWPHWKKLVTAVEDLGFAGLYLSDHYLLQEPPPYASLELIPALTYLADHTRRIHFGPMVSPLSIREPVMLARQAIALDDLSDGRMILGVGAGWNEPEHAMFGYHLGDMATRMARFEEGLEVITRLLRNSGPVNYQGHFFQLHEALLLPQTQRPGRPPLLIGGSGPRRTLPLVARYADIWNAGFRTVDAFTRLRVHLDQLLQETGRSLSAVKRTYTVPVICGRDMVEIEARLRGWRRKGSLANLPTNAVLDHLHSNGMILGTPGEVVAQIRAYASAGVDEFLVEWAGVDDIEGLEVLAEQVLPHFAT
jgi:alkanesulfonate monooxygenase SsuD/methylene tetrahydromethanopterin reductase-like flavin-dependent oxidoreductase (luciferase family)